MKALYLWQFSGYHLPHLIYSIFTFCFHYVLSPHKNQFFYKFTKNMKESFEVRIQGKVCIEFKISLCDTYKRLLMGLINLLFKNPLAFMLIAIPLLYSIIIHELAHGWVAYKMGDSTAKWLGRLSLNPIRHLDPIGTLMLFVFGFGWAKPVPVNFENLRDERKGLIFVSAAGIVANIILAFLSILLLRVFAPSPFSIVSDLLKSFAQINIMLASFNLIPVPPLDGSKILMGFVSRRFQYTLASIEPYGMFIIIGLLWLHILDPIVGFFWRAILGLINLFIP
jgi:Zn-dependent protease